MAHRWLGRGGNVIKGKWGNFRFSAQEKDRSGGRPPPPFGQSFNEINPVRFLSGALRVHDFARGPIRLPGF